jgi:hypothetical protein
VSQLVVTFILSVSGVPVGTNNHQLAQESGVGTISSFITSGWTAASMKICPVWRNGECTGLLGRTEDWTVLIGQGLGLDSFTGGQRLDWFPRGGMGIGLDSWIRVRVGLV